MSILIGVTIGWSLNMWRLHRQRIKRRHEEDARFVEWLRSFREQIEREAE